MTRRSQWRPSPRVELSLYSKPATRAPLMTPQTCRTVSSFGAAKSRSVEKRPSLPIGEHAGFGEQVQQVVLGDVQQRRVVRVCASEGVSGDE